MLQTLKQKEQAGLKDKSNVPTGKNIIKNKSAIAGGLIAAFIVIFFLDDLFQGLCGYLFNAVPINFEFGWTGLTVVINLANVNFIFSKIIIILSPVISIILSIELSHYFLKKLPLGFFRFSILVFQLILAGYLMITVFYGAVSILLKSEVNNIWVNLATVFELSEGKEIVLIFLMVIILFGYLNLIQKRISNYITVPISKTD